MATFTYTGTTGGGERVTETVEANDRYAVYEVARAKGHTVIAVSEASGRSFGRFFSLGKINSLLGRVKEDEIVMLTRNLAAMLRAGLALSRALSVAERQTKNVRLKETLATLGRKLNEGIQFHESLTEFPKIFSRLYVAMVRAGEESGKLAESLQIISDQLERTLNLKKKIKGAMIYPSIVVVVMLIIGVLMMIYVIPTLTATFKELNADLPMTTQFVIFVSDFLSQHSLMAIALMVVLIGSFISLLRTKSGRRGFEWVLLHLPVIGTLAKETNAARTTRTMSSLLSSGVDVVQAISITNDVVQNSYYRDILQQAALDVEKGKQLSESFTAHTNLYPVLVGEMVSVGEETGQISTMLLEVAKFYENEVEQKTKDLSTIIEPVLMVFIGGVVGFFALAMIAPIYSISESI